MEYFQYGEAEMNYLKQKDKRLAAVIEEIGLIQRRVNPDLFATLVRTIIGQQISTKAQATIWGRLQADLGLVTADNILAAGAERIQAFGISHRKAGYILDTAHKIHTGEFDLVEVAQLSDADAIKALASLKGIGVWTAEMLLLFSLQRPDILSYGDLAIQRGLRMLYHHEFIDPTRFERYRKRYSPYGSVASLYLWEIAGGAIPGMRDYAKNIK